jgi:hypothetical protein
MRWLLASLLLTAATAHAQPPHLASLSTLRARAAARGWQSETVGPLERWCARPPCADQDRYDLSIPEGMLVLIQYLQHDAAGGYTLDATWQESGAFTFRFTEGEQSIDLTWELTYEPPGLSVGFSAQDTNAVVALDPTDGAHAFTLWITRELGRYLVSATSLRDTALAQRRALHAAVTRGLVASATVREGTFAECFEERSFPEGTGIFDVCPMRMATPEEQRIALAALNAKLSAERTILRAHYRSFHQAIVEALTE